MSDIPPPPPGAMPPPPPPTPPPPPPPLSSPPPSASPPPPSLVPYPKAPPTYQTVPQGWYQQYPQHDRGPRYASFGARLGALLIDGLIYLVFLIPAFVALFAGPREVQLCTINDEARLCNAPTDATVVVAIVLGLAGLVGYLIVFCRKLSRNQTWGMKATGITVVDANRGEPISPANALGWQLAHVLSGFFCYLGYFWMLWDARNQTWHDKIAGTVVVKV